MQISEKAKNYLTKNLNESNLNTVEIKISTSCCVDGYGIHIAYMNSDSNLFVNGIRIKFVGEEEIFNSLKIDLIGEMIVFD
ncbi:MAG: hypothetical protein K6F81_05640 [Acholeplasmatales bacterium]|nr:hypothetical protein [Acholeplasmatales bacterium]